MKIGIGKLILFTIFLIVFINSVWTLNIFTISIEWLFVITTLMTIVSGVGLLVFFLGFIVELWETN